MVELSKEDKEYLEKFNREFGNDGNISLYSQKHTDRSISGKEHLLSDANIAPVKGYMIVDRKEYNKNRQKRLRLKRKRQAIEKILAEKYGQGYSKLTGELKDSVYNYAELLEKKLSVREVDRVLREGK